MAYMTMQQVFDSIQFQVTELAARGHNPNELIAMLNLGDISKLAILAHSINPRYQLFNVNGEAVKTLSIAVGGDRGPYAVCGARIVENGYIGGTPLVMVNHNIQRIPPGYGGK